MSKSKCPHCGGDQASCKDSRPSPRDRILRRRTYQCDDCGYRFATEESVVAVEGDGVVVTERHMAVLFRKEVDALVRKYFGDDEGSLKTAATNRYGPGSMRSRKASAPTKRK